MNFANILKAGAKILGTDIYTAGINAGGNMLGGFVNEFFADRARKKNFETNEQAAKNADARQRAQYKDLYSPEAMMQQYSAAGLSPSMMMSGGQSAVGGTPQGNAGGGASGGYPAPGNTNIDPLKAAQIENIIADTEGKELDNTVKNMEKELKEIHYILDKGELSLMNGKFYDQETNTNLSLWDYAMKHEKFEDFLKNVKKLDFTSDPFVESFINTTKGRELLQTIFTKSKELNTTLAQLGNDKAYAKLFEKYYKKLGELDYANLSAQQIIQDLKAITQQSKLNEEKKKTVNEMLDKIENENVRAIAILLMMLGDRFLGQVNGSISGSTSTATVYKGE